MPDRPARTQVPIRMPHELAARLAEAARTFERSRAEVVCAALAAFLARPRAEQRKVVVDYLVPRADGKKPPRAGGRD